MAQEGRAQLKTYFEKGDKPTEQQFANLIDSCINIIDDGSSSTPDATATIKGKSELLSDAELDSATPSDNSATAPTESAITLGIRQVYRLWKKIFTVFYTKTESDANFDKKTYLANLNNSDTLITTTTPDFIFRNTTGGNITLTPELGVQINGSASSFVIPNNSFCYIKKGVEGSGSRFFAFLAGTGNPNVAAAVWGSITGTLTAQTDLTSYIATQIANLVDSSPATLDTLNELAAALGDDPNFAATITTALGLKANGDSPTFTTKTTHAYATSNRIAVFNANKELVSSSLSELGVDTNQITITTSTSITTSTLDTSNLGQNGRNVIIDNSTNAINFTLNGGVTASYLKHGTGTITLLRGSGREMYVNGSNVASALFNGLVGSTMSIIQVGSRDYVNINNI